MRSCWTAAVCNAVTSSNSAQISAARTFTVVAQRANPMTTVLIAFMRFSSGARAKEDALAIIRPTRIGQNLIDTTCTDHQLSHGGTVVALSPTLRISRAAAH